MAYSQNNLYAQQQMNMNGSRSSSPQPQQMNAAQQQWMAAQYQQQAMSNNSSNRSSMNSMNDLMAQHQKQWKEHMKMTSQNNLLQQIPDPSPNNNQSGSALNFNQNNMMNNNQGGSAMNLNQNNNNMMNQGGSAMNLNQNQQYTAAQYAAWQRQYQQSQNVAASAMNMQQMQNYQMQQQRMLQMKQQQALMAQRQQQQAMMAQQNSQRALFQQQARQNQQNNYYASTGNLGVNNNMNRGNNFNSFRSVPANRNKLDEEREESIDHKHEAFLPPAPQSNKEVKKYVEWRAKRAGIDEQKEIDREIAKRQSMAVASTQQKTNGTFTKKDIENFKTPLLDGDKHKESIDYELGNSYDAQKSGGCCCVVL